MGNKTLNAANKAKNDEFYTQISDISKECSHYKEHFRGKTIFCNCDDPYESDFFKYFHTLTNDEQQQILNYELMVYFCEGTESEKLKWFEIVNVAGAVLTKQELRNAVYTGSWHSGGKTNAANCQMLCRECNRRKSGK